MMRTKRLVIVEGKYDKIKVERILDAMILTTDGFSLFKDKQKRAFIQREAVTNGLLILTDSDAAGFKIRNHISSFVPAERIMHAYIPDVFGKEKRKETFSKEGKLGVEGIEDAILIESFKKAGIEEKEAAPNHTDSYDLYAWGVYGTKDAKTKRQRLMKRLDLPERLSKNNLLKYINRNFSKEEFQTIMEEVNV